MLISLTVSMFFFCFSPFTGMEKSLVDTKPNDPSAEPCENYENLPFHGLQNPPTKVRFPQPITHCLHSLSLSVPHTFNANCCCHFSGVALASSILDGAKAPPTATLRYFVFPSACSDYCFRAVFLVVIFPSPFPFHLLTSFALSPAFLRSLSGSRCPLAHHSYPNVAWHLFWQVPLLSLWPQQNPIQFLHWL